MKRFAVTGAFWATATVCVAAEDEKDAVNVALDLDPGLWVLAPGTGHPLPDSFTVEEAV